MWIMIIWKCLLGTLGETWSYRFLGILSSHYNTLFSLICLRLFNAILFWSFYQYFMVVGLKSIGVICSEVISFVIIVSYLWRCAKRFLLIIHGGLLFCVYSRIVMVEPLRRSILIKLLLLSSTWSFLGLTFSWCGYDVGSEISFRRGTWNILCVDVSSVDILTNYILSSSSLGSTIQIIRYNASIKIICILLKFHPSILEPNIASFSIYKITKFWFLFWHCNFICFSLYDLDNSSHHCLLRIQAKIRFNLLEISTMPNFHDILMIDSQTLLINWKWIKQLDQSLVAIECLCIDMENVWEWYMKHIR